MSCERANESSVKRGRGRPRRLSGSVMCGDDLLLSLLEEQPLEQPLEKVAPNPGAVGDAVIKEEDAEVVVPKRAAKKGVRLSAEEKEEKKAAVKKEKEEKKAALKKEKEEKKEALKKEKAAEKAAKKAANKAAKKAENKAENKAAKKAVEKENEGETLDELQSEKYVEEGAELEVRMFEHEGVQWLKDDNNVLYSPETHKEVARWNPEEQAVMV